MKKEQYMAPAIEVEKISLNSFCEGLTMSISNDPAVGGGD